MDQKLRTYAERQTDNKRKADNSSRNNHDHQQQPFKRQNVTKVYNTGRVKRSRMVDLCPSAPSAIFITMARVLKNATNVTRAVPKGNGWFEYGAPGHFKRDCPKLKNKDGGNRDTQGWVYAVGNAEKNGNDRYEPDTIVVHGYIFAKKEEDKSEGKQLKDVPIVQDFLKCLLETFRSASAPTGENHIRLYSRSTPNSLDTRRRFAPSQMKELSKQL
ncbi:hypothetical protein Tco_0622591 [Tanacetum coccineum]